MRRNPITYRIPGEISRGENGGVRRGLGKRKVNTEDIEAIVGQKEKEKQSKKRSGQAKKNGKYRSF